MPTEQTPSGVTIVSEGVTVTARSAVLENGRRSFQPELSSTVSEIDEGLLAANFGLVDTLAVTAAPVDDGRRSFGAEPAPELRVDVPLGANESAALLVEDESGLLTWQVADAPGSPGDVRRGAPAVASFVVPLGARGEGEPGRRSFVGDFLMDKLIEPVRVHVLRFLAGRSIDALVDWIEGDLVAGPIVIAQPEPASWKVGPLSLAAARIPTERPARVLLMVHGTFSTTLGSFGALDAGVLRAAIDAYDLILGYDHRTLAATPEHNAAAILAMLHALNLPEGSTIDAVAYSRGGLVLRALVEQQAPETALRATFERCVFIGCTNGGTLLADPDNWKALADLYTNILLAGARVIGFVAGAGVGMTIASEAIKTLGRFVQILPQVAIGDRRVPGLAAMEPGSTLVTALNGAPAPAEPAPRYFAVTSDFEPGALPELAKRAAMILVDGLVDQLFGAPNDLVVHTESMTEFGTGRAVEVVVPIGRDGHVYHTRYFASPEAVQPLAEWLELTPRQVHHQRSAGPAPSAAPAREEYGGWDWDRRDYGADQSAREFGSGGGGWDRALPSERRDWSDHSYGSADRSGPAGIDWSSSIFKSSEPAAPPAWSGSAPEPEPAASPLPAFETQTERYIAAEMMPFPDIARPANLYVTVSPQPLTVGAHAAADVTDAPVKLSKAKPLTVRVSPRLNCEVVGDDEEKVDIEDGDEVICKFAIKGQKPGTAELLVEANQGASTVATFLLAPVFVAQAAEPLRSSQSLVPASPTEGQAVLRIYEFNMGNGGLRLQFNLTSDEPEFADLQTLVIDGGFSLEAYAAGVLKDVENAWNLREAGGATDIYNRFLSKLTSDAKQRTIALVPEPVRRCLWKNRKSISEIRVISSEPHIPWELMYLSDPDGEDKERQGFLAEWGLVRWLHDAPLRRRRVSMATGTKHFVVPQYGGAATLNGAQQERTMLAYRFPDSQEITPDSDSVRTFLQQAENCALLHFACHGRTQQNSVISSELLMGEGKTERGKTLADALTWQDVAANADFGKHGGPLVFVNACQTGQQGSGITGAAGFANAFLRPQTRRGAAAFIGALWSVDDKLANLFADTVYTELAREGATLTGAVRKAREVCKTNNDFTWLAYSVYASG
ncbi:CHAT domain-containing protein [Novosphingobium sp. 9U]|uniref:DUF7379 domain-containing protein n=1 Tax=Novosphingobium sp. 9U TaxID=2653158 RepID=UPI0012F3BFA6|nr:CHAT domain-containing protein [Novosphingobium sp. 9U]VWX54610.1 conserved hypothetical protein [Novosphingobium sp. 9U]